MSSPLSAFTAVPNPQMLAFMGTQSFIMMYQAGEGWQYGKRKQSAMSNEEFNKQTPLSIMDRQRTELIQALPSIADSMNAMTPLISTIVKQYGDFIKEAANAAGPAIQNATSDLPFFAYGDTGQTTQKQFQAQDNTTDWLTVVQSLAKWLTGGSLIKVPGPNPNPETETERIANDKKIQSETITLTAEEHAKIREQNKFGNIVPKNPVASVTSIKQTHSYEQAQYQNKVFTLKSEIEKQKVNYNTKNQTYQQKLRNSGSSGASSNQLNIARVKAGNELVRRQKLLQNYITQSRNNIKLKALANNDWNNRIWK